MLNIPCYKGNANQNYIESLPHCTQNGYQEHKQLLVRMWGKKGPLYTTGENVNQCNCYGNQYGCSSKN
jgi:hypothetical protein